MFLHETVSKSDYCNEEEKTLDISSREALASDRSLTSFPNLLGKTWMDELVDNRAVLDAWSREEGVYLSAV